MLTADDIKNCTCSEKITFSRGKQINVEIVKA